MIGNVNNNHVQSILTIRIVQNVIMNNESVYKGGRDAFVLSVTYGCVSRA